MMNQYSHPPGRRIPAIIVMSFIASAMFSLLLFCNKSLDHVTDIGGEPTEYRAMTVKSKTSIAFYVIAGANQESIDVDLRGAFWEFQLSKFGGNSSVYYISDGPLRVNGVDFLVLPHGAKPYKDAQFCIRTPETWKHFTENHQQTKWYFRGTHDTFVNVSALAQLIDRLEARGDPMKTVLMAFNVHEYGNVLYPQGGTGWLFSNYAVQKFYGKSKMFVEACLVGADDIALPTFFSRMGLKVIDWQTERFIISWPLLEFDVILQKKYDNVPDCPEGYRLYADAPLLKPALVRNAAAIHMHHVPMDKAWKLMCETPPDFAVYFPDPNTPKFCRMR